MDATSIGTLWYSLKTENRLKNRFKRQYSQSMKLKIKNKEYGLQWGTGAFEICCDTLGIDLADIDLGIARNDQKIWINLVYAAIQNWCELQDEPVECEVTYRKLQAWIDTADNKIGKEITESYLSSMYRGKTMQQHYESLMSDDNEEEPTRAKKKSRSVKS